MILLIANGFFAVSAAQNDRGRVAVAILLALLFTFAAIAPIYSYDFFWHLAAGRWITEHHALPLHDPFAVASDRTQWIDGEWLFQIVLYATGRLAAASWLRALFIGITFAIVFCFAQRDDAAFLTALAFAGGVSQLGFRPSTIAAGLLALAIISATRRSRAGDIAFVVITIVWINVHPSAVIAPIVALLLRPRLTIPSAIALFVNPYGWRAIAAPISLTAYARSGAFVNAEWLPSPPQLFPLLYVCVLIGAIVFAMQRKDVARFALFALLAYLAIAHVRNQGLFFAAFPLLCLPIPKTPLKTAAATLLIAWTLYASPHHNGIAPHRFPIASVNRLMHTPFTGNIYNPDQFGGYLIWSFYPQRRALTDGRNELYHAYIPEYAKARNDSRAWHALLQKYRIDLAVDEDRGLIDTVNPVTKQHRAMTASLAYWPQNEWAMIAKDDVSMVFVRRAAFSRDAIAQWELAR